MKHCITAKLARLCVFLLFTPIFAFSQEKEMRVLKVKEDNCVAYIGGIAGVKEQDFYSIVRDNLTIGKAQVIAVEKDICGLKITEVNSGFNVEIGDYLHPDLQADAELQESEEQLVSKELTDDARIHFLEGENKAADDYSGNRALTGGLLSGTFLNVIGWGGGYAYLSTRDVEIPETYLSNLQGEEKSDFRSGYKQSIDKKRKRRFHIGAAIGTVVSTALVLSVLSR